MLEPVYIPVNIKAPPVKIEPTPLPKEAVETTQKKNIYRVKEKSKKKLKNSI
jgi:hypothetical protein